MEPVKSYFETQGVTETPVITEGWSPNFGWNKLGNLDVTAEMVRKLRRFGYHTVGVTAGRRTADFRLDEMASEYVGLGPVPTYYR